MFEEPRFVIQVERVVKFATYGVTGSQRFKPPTPAKVAENKDKAREYARNYERKNRAKRTARQRAKRMADPERFRNYTRRWRERQKAKEGR